MPQRQPCFTGVDPSGAARIAAKHNTGKVAGFVCPSPTGRLNTKQENKANPHNSQFRSCVNRGQGPSLFKCFVYPICIVRATLLEPAGQPAVRLSISQPSVPSNWPNKLYVSVGQFDMTLCRPPISNNQKHPTADPRYALSPPSRFWGANWVLLRHDCHTTLEETI